jgi:hypothetical protein
MMVAEMGATIAAGKGEEEAMAGSKGTEMVVEGSSDLSSVTKEGTRKQPFVRILARRSSRR